jgi:hypothetical protein
MVNRWCALFRALPEEGRTLPLVLNGQSIWLIGREAKVFLEELSRLKSYIQKCGQAYISYEFDALRRILLLKVAFFY